MRPVNGLVCVSPLNGLKGWSVWSAARGGGVSLLETPLPCHATISISVLDPPGEPVLYQVLYLFINLEAGEIIHLVASDCPRSNF